MNTLSCRIKEALSFSGISQTDLARACKITPTSVNNWVSGETKSLKYATAIPAAKALGVRPEWLTQGKGPMADTQGVPEVSSGIFPPATTIPDPHTHDDPKIQRMIELMESLNDNDRAMLLGMAIAEARHLQPVESKANKAA